MTMTQQNRFFQQAILLGAMLCGMAACGGGKDGSPTSPSPTPTTPATRIIQITGDLSFGDLLVGDSATRPITIRNTGAGPLTITGLTGPAGFTASWTSGQILAGGSQDVSVRFSPTEVKSYVGTLTINGDQTSGQNTVPINARGVAPLFTRSGTGNTVFDMPTTVSRIHIVGTYNGNSSNFIVRIGGRLVVNELLGTGWSQTRYDGVHLTSGGVVEITNSSGVAWTFEEVR
jgi:hypothetical protein